MTKTQIIKKLQSKKRKLCDTGQWCFAGNLCSKCANTKAHNLAISMAIRVINKYL